MSSALDKLNALPDVNFVDTDVETLLAGAISTYETEYYNQTGVRKTLAPGDPIRILLYAQSLLIYQALQKVNWTGRQNLLKYSGIDVTRNKGIDLGVEQLPASPALVTMRFTLSEARESVIPIPQGTLVTAGDNVFFATSVYAEVSIGGTYVDVVAACTEAGEVGNGYLTGQINTLVEPIGYITSVANLGPSQGGAEAETNEALKERIISKPDSFSVAGPESAYKYFVKSFSPAVDDVYVESSSPGVVTIRFLLQNGELPGGAMRTAMAAYLEEYRPLTDLVITPEINTQAYDIDVTYWVDKSDESIESLIISQVQSAVDGYILWQRSKLGRAIDPTELVYLMKAAGAKRVAIADPIFSAIDPDCVARENDVVVAYGGLENG